jgi:hypothetical protein
MSILGNQTFVNKTRDFWFPIQSTIGTGGGGSVVSSFQTASVSSLTVSSINDAAPGGGGGGETSTFQEAYVNNLFVSSVNGVLINPSPTLLGYDVRFGLSTTSSEGSVDINFDKPYEAQFFAWVTPAQQLFSPELCYVQQKNGLSNFTVTLGSNTDFNWLTIGK